MAAKDRFLESMYAFAATHEISGLIPWWATHVPIMPTLRRERRGGYDVRFDLPGSVLLIQYKASVQRTHLKLRNLQRTTKKLVKELRALATSGLDQFWTVDHQHKLLARIATRFPFCYYAAPRFTSRAELDSLFSRKKILASSILIKLDEFPPPKRGTTSRHRVIAPIGVDQYFIFSAPASTLHVDMRKELKNIWRTWDAEKPLGETLDEIWRTIPRGNKTKAMSYARGEVATLKQLLPPPRPILLPSAESGERPARARDLTRRRTRNPPWPENAFRSLTVTQKLGDECEHLRRLMALSFLMDLFGVQMSIIQPSEKAV